MAPNSRRRSLSPQGKSPAISRRRVNSDVSRDTELQATNEGAWPKAFTTVSVALVKFENLMDCKLDDFNTYDEYWRAFVKSLNEFHALPGSERLSDYFTLTIFAGGLGHFFESWLRDLSMNWYFLGSGPPEPRITSFIKLDALIRDGGLYYVRRTFWDGLLQTGGVEDANWIPKWMYIHSKREPHHLARLRADFSSMCTTPGHENSPHTNGQCRGQCPHLRPRYVPDDKDLKGLWTRGWTVPF